MQSKVTRGTPKRTPKILDNHRSCLTDPLIKCYKTEITKHNITSVTNTPTLTLATNGKHSTMVTSQMVIWGMTRQQALSTWHNYKTKQMLEASNLSYTSPMRIVWELTLESNNDPCWFEAPFDM